MKKFLCSLLAVSALVPLSSFAQTSTQAVTRAQVRAELAQLEAVGYRPSTHDADYPQALMSAESKVAAMNSRNDGYGGAQPDEHASGAVHARIHEAH